MGCCTSKEARAMRELEEMLAEEREDKRRVQFTTLLRAT